MLDDPGAAVVLPSVPGRCPVLKALDAHEQSLPVRPAVSSALSPEQKKNEQGHFLVFFFRWEGPTPEAGGDGRSGQVAARGGQTSAREDEHAGPFASTQATAAITNMP